MKGIMSYKFGAFTINKTNSLKSGTMFKNPSHMEIVVNSGPIQVELHMPNSAVPLKTQGGNPLGGLVTFDFKNGGVFGSGIPQGEYSITLKNISSTPGGVKVNSGQLWFDDEP